MPAVERNPVVRLRFGSRLRGLRLGWRMKQAALGAALGYSTSMISEIEKGHRAPSLDRAVAIADYFGVSLDVFLKTEPASSHDPWLLLLRRHILDLPHEHRLTVARMLETLANELKNVPAA